MNKKKLYSFITIIILLLLIIGKNFFSGSAIEQLPAWSLEADSISIKQKTGEVLLTKKGEFWYLENGTLKAADKEIIAILKKMRSLKIFDKVSDSGNYARYDLNDEKAVRIVVKSGDTVLSDVFVGKRSSGMSQSYIRIEGDSAVYLAGSLTPDNFKKSRDQLRNKEIVRVSQSAIDSITCSYEGAMYTLIPKNEEVEKEDGTKETQGFWKLENNETLELDSNAVISMFNSLNPFLAASFSSQANEEGSSALGELTINAYNKVIKVYLHKKFDDGNYLVTSSESSDNFLVPERTVKLIFRNKEDLMKK